MKYLKRLFLLFIFIFISCSETDDRNTNSSRLNIILENNYHRSIAGVEVKLYSTKEDYNQDINCIATVLSDAKGYAVFENLQQIKYYWRVNKSCYDSNNDVLYSSSGPLTNGVNTYSGITLTRRSYGKIIFINNTATDYYISFTSQRTGPTDDGDDGPSDGAFTLASNSRHYFGGIEEVTTLFFHLNTPWNGISDFDITISECDQELIYTLD